MGTFKKVTIFDFPDLFEKRQRSLLKSISKGLFFLQLNTEHRNMPHFEMQPILVVRNKLMKMNLYTEIQKIKYVIEIHQNEKKYGMLHENWYFSIPFYN